MRALNNSFFIGIRRLIEKFRDYNTVHRILNLTKTTFVISIHTLFLGSEIIGERVLAISCDILFKETAVQLLPFISETFLFT